MNSSQIISYVLPSLDRVSEFEHFLQQMLELNHDPDSKTNLTEDFVEVQKELGFPITNKETVVFVTRSKSRSVKLLSDFFTWDVTSAPTMWHILGTDLHFLRLILASDSRGDYAFHVNGNTYADPFNLNNGSRDGSSELQMEDYTDNEAYYKNPSVPQGWFEDHEVASRGLGRITLRFYIPHGARPTKQPLPHIYFFEGLSYIRYGKAQNVIDNGVHTKIIPPSIFVFVDVPQGNVRSHQPSTLRHKYVTTLRDDIIPFVESHYPSTGHRAHVGKATGALSSLWVAKDLSSFFTRIGVQSPDLVLDNSIMKELGQGLDLGGARWYLTAGTYDAVCQPVEQLAALLQASNASVYTEFFNQGHSWGLWRATLLDLLGFLFFE